MLFDDLGSVYLLLGMFLSQRTARIISEIRHGQNLVINHGRLAILYRQSSH
jgi:hypothetical protein